MPKIQTRPPNSIARIIFPGDGGRLSASVDLSFYKQNFDIAEDLLSNLRNLNTSMRYVRTRRLSSSGTSLPRRYDGGSFFKQARLLRTFPGVRFRNRGANGRRGMVRIEAWAAAAIVDAMLRESVALLAPGGRCLRVSREMFGHSYSLVRNAASLFERRSIAAAITSEPGQRSPKSATHQACPVP